MWMTRKLEKRLQSLEEWSELIASEVSLDPEAVANRFEAKVRSHGKAATLTELKRMVRDAISEERK